MSHRIAILPEIITNKIAAGEVVERPASVIKELIENALDAGATDIAIEISAGGRRLIRITDNGHGMSREDALLSLERHATSKIRTDSDLDGILTLGFRGEALPSIASVSRFRLTTREPDSLEGTDISMEGGRIRDVKACGMASGTVINVEQLFFNTPARLKFLRSAETEAAHVADSVTRMAVSRPDVAFCCTSDGRELLRVQRGDLFRRLTQVLGKNSVAALHAVESSADGVEIAGFVSSPSGVRSTTAAMFTYINGRFVRDRVVQHAIMQAYRGVIDRGRYPVCALFISLPPGEVDVNVHPTKHEVRFRRQTLVHDTLQAAISNVLKDSPWLAKRQPVSAPSSPSVSQAYLERVAAAAQVSLELPRRDPVHHASTSPHSASQAPESAPPLLAAPAVMEPAVSFATGPAPSEPVQGYFSSLTVIGQFHAEYLLCQSGTELVIIDQHAASERVAFQRLRREYESGVVESQRLLFPETVELTHGEVAAARRFAEELARFGFEIEPFGGNTVIVTAVPRMVSERDCIKLVRDLVAELSHLGASSAFRDMQDNLLSRIACHSVMRGPRLLEHRQTRELLRSMDETDFAATCPHGRPVSHTITHAELEKIFKRI